MIKEGDHVRCMNNGVVGIGVVLWIGGPRNTVQIEESDGCRSSFAYHECKPQERR